MNREELEKMFDEKFSLIADAPDCSASNIKPDVKDFIFDIIIPEVLNSITDKCSSYDLDYIKFKAKELYNINL